MAGFDPEIFGAPDQGFDREIFGTPSAKPKARAASMVENDAITKGAREFPSQGSDALGGASQAALNLLGGFTRGAGSIASTGMRLLPNALGGDTAEENAQRRAGIDQNAQAVGAQPDSWMYKGGKLGGEVAGTAGVGNALALPARAISGLSSAAGAGAIPALDIAAKALSTGGFRTGQALSPLANVLTRGAAGAAVGGVSAGMVNPEDAGTGALIGGALPVGAQAVGRGAEAIGSALRGKQPNSQLMATARQSIDAGYTIPPNMLQPSFKNQVIESISGKQATQQLVSMKNSDVTEGLVRKALGLADDVPLSQGTMENLRKTAGRAYAEVSSLSPQAASDLEALKVARNEAQGWFKAYNRSASPLDLAKAKEARALSDSLETALEAHAADAGKPELIPALRDARKAIAKTYTVGRTLNDASGTVDARVLGRMYEKGLPLSDGLDVAGRFASAFPTIAKTPQQIGSPAAHNLKSIASMMMGGGGFAAMGPGGAALAALPFIAPPLARAQMFSKGTQQGLLNAAPQLSAMPGLLTQGAYRVGPLLLGQ